MSQDQTSLLEFQHLNENVKETRREEVLRAITVLQPCTNKEISEYLQLPINCVTPRVKELRDEENSIVVYAGKKKCRYSKKKVNSWKVKEYENK